jgi:hypothetical protein
VFITTDSTELALFVSKSFLHCAVYTRKALPPVMLNILLLFFFTLTEHHAMKAYWGVEV